MQAARDGKLEEVFGTGTAAVVSPVKKLVWKGAHAYIGDGSIGPVTQKLYDNMTGMQWGKIPDKLCITDSHHAVPGRRHQPAGRCHVRVCVRLWRLCYPLRHCTQPAMKLQSEGKLKDLLG